MRSGSNPADDIPAYHPSAPLKVSGPAADSLWQATYRRTLPLSVAGALLPAGNQNQQRDLPASRWCHVRPARWANTSLHSCYETAHSTECSHCAKEGFLRLPADEAGQDSRGDSRRHQSATNTRASIWRSSRRAANRNWRRMETAARSQLARYFPKSGRHGFDGSIAAKESCRGVGTRNTPAKTSCRLQSATCSLLIKLPSSTALPMGLSGRHTVGWRLRLGPCCNREIIGLVFGASCLF